MKNKEVYEMYKGKMCLKHTVEFYTPITDEEFGMKIFVGQTENSEAHIKSVNDINDHIVSVIGDNLEVDICKIETSVIFGKVFEE